LLPHSGLSRRDLMRGAALAGGSAAMFARFSSRPRRTRPQSPPARAGTLDRRPPDRLGRPIHLHGHFLEPVTGHGDRAPGKHTAIVQPGGTISFDLTADAVGDWAFHCHLLYHMEAGMMRVVSVRPREGQA
jgi:hypothetical protein